MHNAYKKATTKMIRCSEVRTILENKMYKYYSDNLLSSYTNWMLAY